jgi:hypothetical protein
MRENAYAYFVESRIHLNRKTNMHNIILLKGINLHFYKKNIQYLKLIIL